MGRNRRKKECPSLYKTKGKYMPNRDIILFEDCFANGFNESKIPGMFFPRAPGGAQSLVIDVTYCNFRPQDWLSSTLLVFLSSLSWMRLSGSLN